MPDPPTTLNKIAGKFAPTTPPPPPPPPLPTHTHTHTKQRWENGTCWLLRGFILDLGEGGGWGFAVPFYSVQDCRLIGPP